MAEAPFSKLADIYDEVMRFVPYNDWLEYLIDIFRYRKVAPTSILDVACGTGQMVFRLEKLGMRVAGLDASPDMIRIAKRKAERTRSRARFYVAAAETFILNEKFDAAISIFDSLNNISDPAKFARAMRNVAHSLNPGGLFVFDLNTEYSFIHKMFDQDSSPEEQIQYKWRSEYDREAKICTVTMDFTARGESFREQHTQYAYSGEEVYRALKQAGFINLERFNAYSFLPPGRKSDRVFYVAELP